MINKITKIALKGIMFAMGVVMALATRSIEDDKEPRVASLAGPDMLQIRKAL